MSHRVAIRVLRMATLLLGLTLLTFVLIHYSPLDPIQAYVGSRNDVTDAQLEALRARWGLDEPLPTRFGLWITALASGDFGTSFLYHEPVLDVIIRAFLNSLVLMMVSWVLASLLGYALGVLAAFRRGRFLDRLIRWYAFTLVSVPSYVLGLVLLIVFGVWLQWFPIGLSTPVGMMSDDVTFADRLRHFVLPCLTLTFLGVANVALHTRETMNDVLTSDYVLFARARGLSDWRIFRAHGWRNSILPVTMLQFAYFSELFGGSALAEIVFSYHGLGSVMTKAGLHGDVPLLLGTVIIASLFVFFGNLCADIVAEVVDPRVRRSRRALSKPS
ncbi:ABC transporter permease [Bowdeniella nasicola]|uniref:ABC transporter permease n=2 Tax=Bowdeniella nasicola TaxID=208480 RepID=A0A1Q5PWI1_9ACTO|nr:ABC transporter permease [Bowdeniella nasicola]